MTMTGPLVPLGPLEEFIVARRSEKLADYGVEGDQAENVDHLFDLMVNLYRAWSLDELLLRPREAGRFCDAARPMDDRELRHSR
jgi:hypothetical protein